jgi:hypothetical protein
MTWMWTWILIAYFGFGMLFTYSMIIELERDGIGYVEEQPDWGDPFWWLVALLLVVGWPIAMFYRYRR